LRLYIYQDGNVPTPFPMNLRGHQQVELDSVMDHLEKETGKPSVGLEFPDPSFR